MPKLSFLVYELLKVKDYILLITYPWDLEQCLPYSKYLVKKKGRTEGGKEGKIQRKGEKERRKEGGKEGDKEGGRESKKERRKEEKEKQGHKHFSVSSMHNLDRIHQNLRVKFNYWKGY